MSAPALIVVTTSFPSGGDGSEAAGSFVSDLVDELSLHIPVRVVAPGTRDAVEERSQNITVYRYAAPDRPLSTLNLRSPRELCQIGGVLRSGQRATDAAVTAGKSARILALWALPSGHWARRAALRCKVPYAVWTLGSDIWSLGRIPLVRSLLRQVLRDAAICYSDGLQLAEDTQRIAGRSVEFLPSTRRIDLRDPPPMRDQPPYRLLFLGRWHPNKGVDLLLDALAMLSDDDWKRIERVEIQGGGPLEGLVRERVAVLAGVGRPVVAGQFLSKVDAEAAIARADWVLIPSRIESIPVVFSDAMKLRRPVIANPVGDLPALVGNCHSGVSVEQVSVQAYAHALQKACALQGADIPKGMESVAQQFELRHIVDRILFNEVGRGQ